MKIWAILGRRKNAYNSKCSFSRKQMQSVMLKVAKSFRINLHFIGFDIKCGKLTLIKHDPARIEAVSDWH